MIQHHINQESIQNSLSKEEQVKFNELLFKIAQYEKEKIETAIIRLQNK